MIRKAFIFLTIVFLQFSCIPEGLEDGAFVGIRIDVANQTDVEYENLKLHIGGLTNDTFVSTDFFELNIIFVKSDNRVGQSFAFSESRWKTDLNKIVEISNSAYFALEFEDGKIVLLQESFEENQLISFSVLNERDEIKEKYGGRLSFNIKKDSLITGRFFEDTMFR